MVSKNWCQSTMTTISLPHSHYSKPKGVQFPMKLTVSHSTVTIHTTYFNAEGLIFHPTLCIKVFYMSLTINNGYFPTQH